MSRTARRLTGLVGLLAGALVAAAPAQATFPGENGRIAVEGPSCCAGPDPHGFWTIAADGSDLRLTAVGLPTVRDVAWSPDGERVAFTALTHDPPPEGEEEGSSVAEVYTAAADGSDVRRLTYNDMLEYSPSWSPDGKRLSVLTEPKGYTGPQRLAVISAKGGQLHFLRETDTIMAEWSPAGDTIAIAQPLSGIQLVPVAGGEAKTIAPDASVRQFSWAPDGEALAFDDCTSEYCDLYRVNADGTGIAPLLLRSGSRDYIGAPLWSPDGGTVVFCRSLDGADGFWAMGSDGDNPHLLREGKDGCGHWQSWQPVPPPVDPCRAPVTGTADADTMTGGPDHDTLAGLAGDDRLFGRAGPDCLLGGRGADVVGGGQGEDLLAGGPGADNLMGGPGPDTIRAGRGHDRIRGGSGADLIDARGEESDVVDCGSGDDRAVVSASDTVLDCEHVTTAPATHAG